MADEHARPHRLLRGGVAVRHERPGGRAAAEDDIAAAVAGGTLQAVEDVIDGLDRAPAALVGLLAGDNLGKRMVRVGPDPVGV